MINNLLKTCLLTSRLLVFFLLAAGTAFSQTTQGAEKLPQGAPYSEESLPTGDTEKLTQTEPGSGETSQIQKDSEGFAQTGPNEGDAETTPPAVPVKPNIITADQVRPEGPPQWAKDLRRGEIIAFGSLPFTFFFTKTFMDLYRTATHDWDNRYAPGLFKGPGAIPMTDTELKIMFGIAASSSVLVAVVDHFIVKHKRNKARDL